MGTWHCSSRGGPIPWKMGGIPMPHGRQNYIAGHSRWGTPLSRNVLRYQKGTAWCRFWREKLLVFGWSLGHLSSKALVEEARMVGWVQVMERALNGTSKEAGFIWVVRSHSGFCWIGRRDPSLRWWGRLKGSSRKWGKWWGLLWEGESGSGGNLLTCWSFESLT